MDQFLQEKIDIIEQKLSAANDILMKIYTDDTLSKVSFYICSSLAELDEIKEEMEREAKASA